MENKKLKVTYECHQCGFRSSIVEDEHASVQEKDIKHGRDDGMGPLCDGSSHPVNLEEVES